LNHQFLFNLYHKWVAGNSVYLQRR
jgi:hypothetical protein